MFSEQNVGLGNPRVPHPKTWIFCHRLLKELARSLDRLNRALVKQIATTEVQIVSLGIVRRSRFQGLLFAAREPGLQ